MWAGTSISPRELLFLSHHVSSHFYHTMWAVVSISPCELSLLSHHASCCFYLTMWAVTSISPFELLFLSHHVSSTSVSPLYKDSVSLTPLIQVLQGRPLALRPLNLVLYARWAGCWIGSLVRCPNRLILCCWIWWWMLFVPTISLIWVLGIMSLLVLLTASHFTGCNFALQRLGHGPGLALVCECWYEDGVYDFAVLVFNTHNVCNQ